MLHSRETKSKSEESKKPVLAMLQSMRAAQEMLEMKNLLGDSLRDFLSIRVPEPEKYLNKLLRHQLVSGSDDPQASELNELWDVNNSIYYGSLSQNKISK